MYVVKLKYKDAIEPSYANESIICTIKEIRDPNSNYPLARFVLSNTIARKLFTSLIMRHSSSSQDDFWGDEKAVDYIALVELSNYAPNREFQVIEYREFK